MSEFATFHDLAGASVFITGGGSGIGAALTEGFLAQGAKVAFVQRSDATAFVDDMAEKTGNRPMFLPCDITDIPALQAAMAQAASVQGPFGVLVNNAADDTRHALEETTVLDWNANLSVNLRPHFFTMQAAVPAMRQMGGGAIVNFSSITYMMGYTGLPVYATAKAGIVGLTRSMARELGPDGIRVNAVLPGWVQTERQRRLWATPEALAHHLKLQCLPEELEPHDIVDTTLFLASKASRMMTGQALVVDGGVVTTG